MHLRALVLAAVAWTAGLVVVSGQGKPHTSLLRNHPLVAYASTAANDPVAQLDRKLQSGEVQLEFEETRGYLTSVLKALGVPADSQMLVFSKTSFQAPKINPKNPRAIFFND